LNPNTLKYKTNFCKHGLGRSLETEKYEKFIGLPQNLNIYLIGVHQFHSNHYPDPTCASSLSTTIFWYTEAYSNSAGPGDVRPTACQNIKNKTVESKLAGKIIVVTDTLSGIEIETARVLSLTGIK